MPQGRQPCSSSIRLIQRDSVVKKPTIRVTKWLADIPVEAQCTACPDVVFRAKGASHRPNREEYARSLQTQFDAHNQAVHFSEGNGI
jgi:hypothetical protein